MAAKKATVETLKIPALNQKLMKVKIKGTSPIIFHKWSQKAIRMILEKQMKKAQKGREVRDPEAEYRESFYTTPTGDIYIPSRNIKQAIVGSARFIDGVPMTILRGAVFVWGEERRDIIPVLVDGERARLSDKTVLYTDEDIHMEEIAGYDSKNPNIQMRQDMVTVGMGSADIRFRGQVEDWEAEFLIEFDENIFSVEQILNLLQRAGFSQGLGEWRPEKNGDNGTFELDSTSEKA